MSDRPNETKGSDDALNALHGAWARLEAPDPTSAVSDAATEAAVDWMRSVWARLEAPIVAVPLRLRWSRPIHQVRRFLPLAAAASLLAIAGWRQLGTRPGSSPERSLLEIADADLTEVATPTAPIVTSSEGTSNSDEVVTAQPTERVSVMDGENHVIEYGSVRLMFLNPIDGPALGLDNTKEN